MWPIEKRCKQRHTVAFVAPETVDLLAEKMIGIVADRRIAKMRRYLGENRGDADLRLGLRVDGGGDTERRVYMHDEFCTVHERHMEDPQHKYQGACALRQSTHAENLRALASIAEAGA